MVCADNRVGPPPHSGGRRDAGYKGQLLLTPVGPCDDRRVPRLVLYPRSDNNGVRDHIWRGSPTQCGSAASLPFNRRGWIAMTSPP